jgi:protoporphyrinogen oxidase
MKKKHIVVLGGGPAGLGAAWQIAKQNKAAVTVLELNDSVGGNAGSFNLAGLNVDYGSHRLHPQCAPQILSDLKELLGADLLDRPRHGRIRLQNRWIHFPLKPQDLVLKLPLFFGAGIAFDAAKKALPNRTSRKDETFTTVLENGLGTTICREFYFPYAKKIWGLAPEILSATQAQRRVSAGSLGKMMKKVISIVPGFKTPGAGRFYYPRKGFGQISEAIAADACRHGAEIKLNSRVKTIDINGKLKVGFVDEKRRKYEIIEADHIWSTIPLTLLAKLVKPSAPPEIFDAGNRIKYRAMILIYLVLNQSQWTHYDAHYFPEAEIKLTRLSEPKNYGANLEPKGVTILCGELPCDIGDKVWAATDRELADIVRESVEKCGLKINSKILQVAVKRLPFAYPIYQEGYEKSFELLDAWAGSLPNVLTFGRQGLFAHDNTHHALAMAYGAVDCLDERGDFDSLRWQNYRAEFAKHVVED